jgi:hypothetical protein
MTEHKSPSTKFILQRLIRNDIEGTPGWKLNPELRGRFTEMLQEEMQRKNSDTMQGLVRVLR